MVFVFMSRLDLNHKGATNIKSELTKHLFRNFETAYFHLKPRIEATRKATGQFDYKFIFSIEDAFPYICLGKGDRSHINNDDIKMLHERCEQMVAVLKTEQLDDQDKIMLDVVVKTGNYLAITLDLMAQDVRLRALESEVESRKRKHAAGVSSPASTDMHIMMQSLSMMGSENTR
jgi:hypothetical protein